MTPEARAELEGLARAMYAAMAQACRWPNGDQWDRLVPALRLPYLAMAEVAQQKIDAADAEVARLRKIEKAARSVLASGSQEWARDVLRAALAEPTP